jgi:hypothetical protein
MNSGPKANRRGAVRQRSFEPCTIAIILMKTSKSGMAHRGVVALLCAYLAVDGD